MTGGCPPPRTGFLTREERRRLEGLRSPYNKFWVPCAWFGALVGQARREGRVRDDCALKLLMEVPPDPPETPPHSPPSPPPKTLPCPPPAGAEPLSEPLQSPLPLRLDQRPTGVHPGGHWEHWERGGAAGMGALGGAGVGGT